MQALRLTSRIIYREKLLFHGRKEIHDAIATLPYTYIGRFLTHLILMVAWLATDVLKT